MEQPKCCVCQRPAAIHETVVEAGAGVTRHFCKEHGQPLVAPVVKLLDNPAGIRAVEEYFRGLSAEERSNLKERHYLEMLHRFKRPGG